ncbi:ABC transporter permease [candidate division KSB1 bacterium]|nr:ABC transporter permease [candidate division KSB1 bacterium]
MLKLIIEKELRDIIGSTKFAVTFAVSSILILLTFYVGSQNHQVNVARHEAAIAENLRKMEGLTDWIRVRSHRIFLPPQPLEALVTGVSNDIGRTIEMAGRGELSSVDSRFNDDPIFAVFRFLDLDFIFQIVLSLFAILFTFDAINGEKERGTLRLTFANPVPKDKYITGKLLGSFLALGVPLLIPILLGCLLLPIFGVHLAGDEWLKLATVIFTGLLYFGVFLTLSIFVSVLTKKSANSFLALLVFWIFAVFIIPRASVLLAGRAVSVPSVDEHSYQKGRLRAQLWEEDRHKMAEFKPDEKEDPMKIVDKFNEFMQNLADERDKKIQELTKRLNEDRRNKQLQQQRLAFGLVRVSPSALFSLAATNLVGNSLDMKQHFIDEATGYQTTYAQFMKEKTGMNLGGNVILFKMKRGGEEEEEKPIDPKEMPEFFYNAEPVSQVLEKAFLDLGLLVFYNIIFFVGAFVGFIRYDVR